MNMKDVEELVEGIKTDLKAQLWTGDKIQDLPSGRVLRRTTTPKGRHQKMRIVQPAKFFTCDVCEAEINGKAVKTEMNAGLTILTQCCDCAAEELNEGIY